MKRHNRFRKGSGELLELSIVIILFGFLLIAITAEFQMTFTLDALTKAATAAARAAAVSDSRTDAQNSADTVVEEYLAERGEFKNTLGNAKVSFDDVANVFTFGKSSTTAKNSGWEPGQIKKITVSADIKTIEPYFFSKRSSSSMIVLIEGSSPTGLSGMDDSNVNAKMIADFLSSRMGLSKAAILGVMANFEYESGLQSSSVERQGGAGHGLAQWTGARWDGEKGLKKYAEQMGVPWTDLNLQMEFFNQELLESYPSINKYLSGIQGNDLQTAQEVSEYFLLHYEKPKNSLRTSRIKHQNETLEYYYKNQKWRRFSD